MTQSSQPGLRTSQTRAQMRATTVASAMAWKTVTTATMRPVLLSAAYSGSIDSNGPGGPTGLGLLMPRRHSGLKAPCNWTVESIGRHKCLGHDIHDQSSDFRSDRQVVDFYRITGHSAGRCNGVGGEKEVSMHGKGIWTMIFGQTRGHSKKGSLVNQRERSHRFSPPTRRRSVSGSESRETGPFSALEPPTDGNPWSSDVSAAGTILDSTWGVLPRRLNSSRVPRETADIWCCRSSPLPWARTVAWWLQMDHTKRHAGFLQVPKRTMLISKSSQ